MSDIYKFLQAVKLPVMPEVAHALIRTLNDEDADVVTVRNVIAKDPVLTATLLRMANSAIFGLSRTVDTLDNAVSVVGMSQIRARALSICMANVFKFPPNLNRLDFWRNSMICAGYAKWLAHSVSMDEQMAWLTAMMLRLGQLTIAQHSPAALEQIELLPRAPGERWVRERSSAGFDEGEITGEIAARWDFPDTVIAGLRHACQPTAAPDFSRLAGIVHLAALLADNENPDADTLDTLPAALMGMLKLDLEKLRAKMPDAESFSDISMLQA
jgi:HD-like signal output (HDOD) protein